MLEVAAMITAERGLFSPQHEVQKYIPSFKDMEEAVHRARYYSPKFVFAYPAKKRGIFTRMASAFMVASRVFV